MINRFVKNTYEFLKEEAQTIIRVADGLLYHKYGPILGLPKVMKAKQEGEKNGEA